MTKTKICFFGLLHVQKNENHILNFDSKNDDEKILVYLKNAIVLDKQFKKYGYNFILLTNKISYLKKLLRKTNYKILIKQIKFNTKVPKNTHFYSCHFRVDVFRYLSKLKNLYSVLIDLDVLILNDPSLILSYKNKGINLVNNITNNVIPAYGKTKILKNQKLLNSNIKKVKWYGGDFFSGNSNFFKTMHEETIFYQKKFIKNIKYFRDQTDELFISCAIEDIKKKKMLKIEHANNQKIFTRYWNTNVKHNQKSISNFKKFSMLHIPADKIFLSNCFDLLLGQNEFKEDYFQYINSFTNILKLKLKKILPNKIKKKIKEILK